MANPTLKTSAPGYASIVAALWVSDDVDQSGTPSKGAWDAKNSVFYPAWGGASMTGVALGSTTRRGLASSAANCGIDLGLTNNHTGTIFDLAGPELTVVALYRRTTTGTAMVIQNQESYGSGGYCGWSLSPSGTASLTARVRAGVTPPGVEVAAAYTTTNPVGELVCVVYDRSSTVTNRIWKNGTQVAGGSASPNTDPITYGVPGSYLRRAALFNYPESRTFTAGPIELFAVIVYSDGDWTTGGSALTPIGASEAALLGGSFHNAYFDFGDGPPPDTTAPNLSSPTGTKTGATTASGTVSTDEGNGTLYRLASINATESAATVKAAALTSAVSATGSQSVTFTGLTPSTTYYAHYVHADAASNDSARVSSAAFTTDPSGDAVAPTLTGTIAISALTSTSYTATCPVATDNVAVTGYQYRINAGAWTTIGAGARAVNITGRTASTTDTLEMRAFDAATNYSTALSQSVNLPAVSTYSVSAGPCYFNTGSGPQLSVAVTWSLIYANVGGYNGATTVDGTGTLHASTGLLAISGLSASGPADLYIKDAAGGIYYQRVTAA